MKKPKIYLDTSYLSHLHHPDAPDKMQDSLALWRDILAGEYESVISGVTTRELMRCAEPKKTIMSQYLDEGDFEELAVSREADELAQEIIKRGILTARSLDDCTHIALAILNNCDIIVSWNFKHIVNIKTIQGIRQIVISKRYKPIDIYPPSALLKGDE